MEIELRKIHFIQDFLRIDNEKTIEKLETLLKQEKRNKYIENPKTMSIDDLNEMIDRAEKDSQNNRLTSAEQLDKEIDSWR